MCVRGVGFGWLCCAACASSNSPLAALRAFCFVFFFSFFFSMDCFSRVARSRGVARFSPQWTVTFYRGCGTWGPSVSEAEEMGPLAVNGLTCVFASVRGLTC